MSLEPDHISKYLDNLTIEKNKSELLNLLITRIDQLCFETCQVDRVACTLTPRCNRRQFLNLRLVNGVEKIPEFCYNIQKNIILRDFRNKTVIYRPNDTYLYLKDFFDIFYHGDYRKLTRFLEKEQWDKVYDILDGRILYQNEEFEYHHSDHHLIIKYGDKLHVIFIDKGMVLCNANREAISNLELLKGLCDLFSKIYFPDVQVSIKRNKYVEIKTIVPQDIISKISQEFTPEADHSKGEQYFWNEFQEDLEVLSQYCKKIKIYFDIYNNMNIKLSLDLRTNQVSTTGKFLPLRFRDLRWILNYIYRIYTDFYILWL